MKKKSFTSIFHLLVILLLLSSGGCGGGGGGDSPIGFPEGDPTITPNPNPVEISRLDGLWKIEGAEAIAHDADRVQTEYAYYVYESASAKEFEIKMRENSKKPGYYEMTFIGDGVFLSGVPGAGMVTFSMHNPLIDFEGTYANISSAGDYIKIDENTYKFVHESEPYVPIKLFSETTVTRFSEDNIRFYHKVWSGAVTTTYNVTLVHVFP